MSIDSKHMIESFLQVSERELFATHQQLFQNGKIQELLINQCNLIALQRPKYRDELQFFENRFEEIFGQDSRICFNQLIVYKLYLDNFNKIDNQNLPEEVNTLIKEDFARIIKFTAKKKDDFLTIKNPIFLSYLEELCFARYPLGNQSVTVTGFSRKLVLKQKPIDIIKFILISCHLPGNSPLFELHFNPHRMRQFNHKGWLDVFRLGGEMLKSRPEIKGIMGASWFFDPSLEKISPELNYLRDMISEIGGMFFFEGQTEQDKENSFSMSKVRKEAFEKGIYTPSSYIVIIPRKSLLSWCTSLRK